MKQINQDIEEFNLNEEDLDELDQDVKESFSSKLDIIEVKPQCQSYKTATDVTCCCLKK